MGRVILFLSTQRVISINGRGEEVDVMNMYDVCERVRLIQAFVYNVNTDGDFCMAISYCFAGD